ncbi:MAG: CDP-glucose 4,6-dehydratase, partial [Bdellovibrionales bacterium]
MVSSFWNNKKVFLTGHTGFKGSWMSLWLLKSGAKLTGYSLGLPTEPSLFDELKIANDMNSIFADVRNLDQLTKSIKEAEPEIIIHMAAQPLVRYSYQAPVETYMTNVMGTVHLFEAARAAGSVKAVLNVTSDKCYENQEREAGYQEHEPMGGYDPYSNSKGCSELVTSAYRRSFFEKENINLGSGRAGNVIGGGDWSNDRLVPDIVRAVLKNETLVIRNPRATRPWQHVLEPVGGYLHLAEKLYSEGKPFAEGFNFGPSKADHCDVENIILKMNKFWNNKIKYEIVKSDKNPHEAHLLSLDCSKAEKVLGWKPKWNLDQALKMTVDW